MRRPAVTLAGCDPRAIAAAFAASPHVQDREHVARSLARVPFRLHMPAVAAWAKRRAVDYRAANLEMLALSDAFDVGVDLTASDDEIILAAERRARDVRGYLADLRVAEQGDAVRARLAKYCRAYGVAPPTVKTLHGLIARLSDKKWWRRALRRSILRTLEGHAIRLGFVHRRAALYASHEAVDRRRGQRARNRRILESVEAENDSGERFTLAELSSRNVSNPAVRRAELMTRIAGFERFAQLRGDAAMFYTLTCPSRMHASHWKSGEPVENYDGTTPRGAQEYLAMQWAKARAMFKRRRVYVYGFRIAEPHHDGTPHWHLLLFMRPSFVAGATAILEKYAYEKDAHELDNAAARAARFKAVTIDPERGSAAGYVAKYVAKNIDGHRVGNDDEASGADQRHAPSDSRDTVARVDAWAATWGIRQFQQVGGPGVTMWRELRRLGAQQLSLFDPFIDMADRGAWHEYVRAMGGIEIFKRDRTLQLWRVDYEKENRYGEPAPAAIEGVEHLFVEQCRTRLREWQIIGGGHGRGERGGQAGPSAVGIQVAGEIDARRSGPADGQASRGGLRSARQVRAETAWRGGTEIALSRVDVDGFALGSFAGSARVAAVAVAVPWTRVNNCTPLEKSEDCDAWIADYKRAERAGGRGSGPP